MYESGTIRKLIHGSCLPQEGDSNCARLVRPEGKSLVREGRPLYFFSFPYESEKGILPVALTRSVYYKVVLYYCAVRVRYSSGDGYTGGEIFTYNLGCGGKINPCLACHCLRPPHTTTAIVDIAAELFFTPQDVSQMSI